MLGQAGWIGLGVMAMYLTAFAWGTAEAARAAGRAVWLFGRARGIERLAALGFRLAFVLALIGPLLWLAFPMLHKLDPLWTEGRYQLVGAAGAVLAAAGAMLAFAAQMSMGSSWRVGVAQGATGALVSGGLYRFSRNPTFMGQFILLAGISLAIPAIPTLLAPLLFLWSASTQIGSEERELKQALGADYSLYLATVPRWIGFHRRTSS